MKLLLFLCLGCLFAFHISFSQQKGYYRSPSIHGNLVVFTAEGDLWKYDRSNGITNRLTTHSGVESKPVISPDGKQIVFTGQYEGATELYVMNSTGSVPKRLTYNADGGVKPLEWTRDGRILYSTLSYNLLPDRQLVKLDPLTLNFEIIPLSEGSDGCYDNADILYFTRLPKQPSNNKRYKGGTIQQIWKYDGKQETSCLTCDFDGTSYNPMIFQDRIFFISDRDGTMNIWSMDHSGNSLKQHTFSKGWDILSASISGSQIAFQQGADIWLYDIDNDKENLLDINLESDFDQRKPRWIKNPGAAISFTSLSPEGNFLSLISRGRIFDAPVKGERWIEVNPKSGIRVKEVHFLNNKTLVYLSDESGEFEIWKAPADGSGVPRQLTNGSNILITRFLPSPNGKYIAYHDKNEVLRIIDTTTGLVRFEFHDRDFGINNISWSTDSKDLTFSHGIENLTSQINVVEIETGKSIPITTRRLDSYDPCWSSDNRWLYFLSDRNLETKVSSPWGPRQPEPYYSETTNIYALQLDTAFKFPFYQDDPWLMDTTTSNSKSSDKNAKVQPNTTAALSHIDWQQLSGQLFRVPIKSGNLNSLAVTEGWLYWIDRGTGEPGSVKLFALKIDPAKKNEPIEIVSGLNNFQLSQDKKKILIQKANILFVTEANGVKLDPEKSKVELGNWNFQINPPADWDQMFADAWRMMRDYYYDPGMQHIDWIGMRKKYEPLVARITDRDELDDLIAQMVAELSTLHTFVFGGDKRRSPDWIPLGFLGGFLKQDDKGLKISHVYRNDPDFPETLSPLARPGLRIREGDIITAINDVPIKDLKGMAELLENKVNQPVKLSLLNKQQLKYQQIVRPESDADDYSLRYSEWELTRREKVDSLSQDQIGYVHLRAMSQDDMNAFVKQYYPVFNRKGLIIDVRHNQGGNIDSWILEKLIRKAWFYWKDRTGKPYWNMQFAFRGHMVVLCDQFTASDGEAFTEGFKRLGLGKAIGMRTWGGEIWLSADNRLVDNGIASAAETGVFGPEGQWLIEGHGVDPDYVIDNLPNETFKGKDAQLEFAIDYLKKIIEKEPVADPVVPAYPDKSFKYNPN